ncbi:MAG TPA: His/Gly/Thr/Pro-type tRNA ligase C-terminal domain-containing protein [Candidatus Paceibacterota bacterium]|nr:His/Gly/Thr/Pro-type tRNA ligase C-terminal domain-containing protein [Candidatus Paceibacterota bacterium]HRZ34481.1 His/Gly/Thr/Pro-type tRNA ligase C-terminal domain-containing protein [Candidatus Paceibacterota bacterium]
MRQSKLFTKTRRSAPKDEISKSAQYLIRAGFIHKQMAGVYTLLPLGLMTMKKIEQVIREEMNKIGGVELSLTALQDPEVWKKTDRWDDDKVDNWFKTKLKNGTQLGLGFTHEEPLTEIMTNHIHSYKDLPIYAYQFQTKFRNELRAKSGILRGREFLMKDLYSFSKNQKEHDEFYKKAQEAYKNIFHRLGIGDRTYMTFASGGVFSQFSHEFQTLTETGEDTIFVDEKKKIAVNKEVCTDEILAELGLSRKNLKEVRAIEVGNIFNLGTRFSEPLSLVFDDEKGEKHPVIMGSYGIGLGRVMGTLAEVLSDEKGLVWPAEASPFAVHLINVSPEEEAAVKTAEDFYENLVANGLSVLYDDRKMAVGEKLADADLIGIKTQIIVGAKSIQSGEFEIRDRQTGSIKKMSEADILKGKFAKA